MWVSVKYYIFQAVFFFFPFSPFISPKHANMPTTTAATTTTATTAATSAAKKSVWSASLAQTHADPGPGGAGHLLSGVDPVSSRSSTGAGAGGGGGWRNQSRCQIRSKKQLYYIALYPYKNCVANKSFRNVFPPIFALLAYLWMTKVLTRKS